MNPQRSALPAEAVSLRAALEQRILGGELELPLLPASAGQVVAESNDENCDARRLAERVARDPSMAAHVLRMANSAAYTPSEPIVSLQQALSRLGLQTVCAIAVSVALKQRVFRCAGHERELQALWKHSAAAGAYAREIAKRRKRNAESAFLCGLLHDVGRPVVLQCLIDTAQGRPLETALFEELIEEFHPRVGGDLVRRWGLPEWAANAAQGHRDPTGAGRGSDEAWTVHLASALSHWATEPETSDLEALRNHPALVPLNLYAEDLEALIEKRERVVEFAGALV